MSLRELNTDELNAVSGAGAITDAMGAAKMVGVTVGVISGINSVHEGSIYDGMGGSGGFSGSGSPCPSGCHTPTNPA